MSLIPAGFNLPVPEQSQKELMGMATSYLPYVQLCSSKSQIVTEGKIPMNHYGLMVGDSIIDLGGSPDLAIFPYRVKAMRKQPTGGYLFFYDKTTKEFQETVNLSAIKDSGHMFGPEFLVWVPSQTMFATLFCGSKTARGDAISINKFVGQWATFGFSVRKSPQYTWVGMTVQPCATSHAGPDPKETEEVLKKFLNPPKVEVEEAPKENRER